MRMPPDEYLFRFRLGGDCRVHSLEPLTIRRPDWKQLSNLTLFSPARAMILPMQLRRLLHAKCAEIHLQWHSQQCHEPGELKVHVRTAY